MYKWWEYQNTRYCFFLNLGKAKVIIRNAIIVRIRPVTPVGVWNNSIDVLYILWKLNKWATMWIRDHGMIVQPIKAWNDCRAIERGIYGMNDVIFLHIRTIRIAVLRFKTLAEDRAKGRASPNDEWIFRFISKNETRKYVNCMSIQNTPKITLYIRADVIPGSAWSTLWVRCTKPLFTNYWKYTSQRGTTFNSLKRFCTWPCFLLRVWGLHYIASYPWRRSKAQPCVLKQRQTCPWLPG